MSIYKIRKDYMTWVEKVIELEGEITPELMGELHRIEGDAEEKFEAYAIVLKEQRLFRGNLDAEMAELKRKKERSQKLTERLEESLTAGMRELNRDRFETARCTVSFRRSTAVVIDDDAKIPEKYIKDVVIMERVPLKQELAAALKAGEVPGCHLEERRNIQVR